MKSDKDKKEKRNACVRKWRKNNPKRTKEIQNKYYKNNKEKYKRDHLKYTYGLTLKDYNKLLQEQRGVCAICGRPETRKNQHGIRSLCIDHNHGTNKIRGLLCANCNSMVGYSEENITVLHNAITYLLEYLR